MKLDELLLAAMKIHNRDFGTVIHIGILLQQNVTVIKLDADLPTIFNSNTSVSGYN